MAPPEYSNNDMRAMRDSAMKRVSDMQRLANENLQKSQGDNGIMPSYRPAPAFGFGFENSNGRGTIRNSSSNRRSSGVQNNNPTPEARAETVGRSINRERSPYRSSAPVRENPESNTGNHDSVKKNMQNGLGGILSEFPDSLTSPLQGVMKSLNIDTERLIIIGLIIMLLNEGADRRVILALAYILF